MTGDRQAVRGHGRGPGRAEGHRPVDGADRARPRRAGHRHRRGGLRPGAVRPRGAAGGARGHLPGPATTAQADENRSLHRGRAHDALYASKVVAYAQGFDQIAAAPRSTTGTSTSARWPPSGAAAASSAPASSTGSGRRTTTPGPANLLLDDYFPDAIGRRPGGLAAGGRPTAERRADARLRLRAGVLRRAARRAVVAALIQGLRDFFGAHTYQRVDRDGAFHTLWAEEGRREVDTADRR